MRLMMDGAMVEGHPPLTCYCVDHLVGDLRDFFVYRNTQHLDGDPVQGPEGGAGNRNSAAGLTGLLPPLPAGLTGSSSGWPSLSSHHRWFQGRRPSYTNETWWTSPPGPSPAPPTLRSLLSNVFFKKKNLLFCFVAVGERNGDKAQQSERTLEVTGQTLGHVLVEILDTFRRFVCFQLLKSREAETLVGFASHEKGWRWRWGGKATFLLDMFMMKTRHCLWISRPGLLRVFKKSIKSLDTWSASKLEWRLMEGLMVLPSWLSATEEAQTFH